MSDVQLPASDGLDLDRFEISTAPSKGRCLFAKNGLKANEVVIKDESPVCIISYNPSSSSSLDGNSAASTSSPSGYVDSDDEEVPADSSGISGSDRLPWLEWGYRPHELRLLKDMNYNILAVSLPLLAARLIECVSKPEISGFSNSDLLQICKPDQLTSEHAKKLQVSSLLSKRLLEEIGITSVSEDVCLDAISRLSCNVFTITDGYSSPVALGLYRLGSSINHSCSPSCSQSFSGMLLSITSIEDSDGLAKEVTISYSDSSKSTWSRRMNLFDSYYFMCNCDRCNSEDTNDSFLCPNRNCNANSMTNNKTKSKGKSKSKSQIKSGDDLTTNSSSLHQVGSCYPSFPHNDKSIYDSDIRPSEELDRMIRFLDDICLPFGDIWIDLVRQREQDSSFRGVGTHSASSISPVDCLTRLMESSDGKAFKCTNCSSIIDINSVITQMKAIYDLWTQYQSLLLEGVSQPTSSASNSGAGSAMTSFPNRITELKLIQRKIVIMESMLAIALTIVHNTHYSIVQITDKLVNLLMESSAIYDWMLSMSPNNSKLQQENRISMEKYTLHAEMLIKALGTCYPKYKDISAK